MKIFFIILLTLTAFNLNAEVDFLKNYTFKELCFNKVEQEVINQGEHEGPKYTKLLNLVASNKKLNATIALYTIIENPYLDGPPEVHLRADYKITYAFTPTLCSVGKPTLIKEYDDVFED